MAVNKSANPHNRHLPHLDGSRRQFHTRCPQKGLRERAGLARPADVSLSNCGIVLTTLEQG